MHERNAAEQLAALGHPARLRALRTLMGAGPDGASAGTLAAAAGLAPSAASFHLDRLRLAGVAGRRRAGREMRYVADFEAVQALLDFLGETCCAGVEGDGTCGPVCGGRGRARTADAREEEIEP